jgi:hypothetical protein
MVYWHTAYKKHHSWMIRKMRGWNFFGVFMGFYAIYWFGKYSSNRTLWYLDRVKPNQAAADRERRDFGYRERYEPLIARSKKHYLLAKGDYAPRLPYEDQLLP